MEFTRTCATGTMGMTIGLVILFVLGASWTCDARELLASGLPSGETTISNVSVLQINHHSDGSVKAYGVGGNESTCRMCVEFAVEAIGYLGEDNTQTEIIKTLRKTCSRLIPFEQQCFSLVDSLVPPLFLEIESVAPGDFCRKINLCEERVIIPPPLSEDKCEICHEAVAEVLLKLKDPDTQLDILEMLLKACDAVERYLKKCKTLVLDYGPLIMDNAEQFLEKTDICTAIHACDLPVTGSKASPSERKTLLSIL